MSDHICTSCGHVYTDEEEELRFEELDESWHCPVCFTEKKGFMAKTEQVSEHPGVDEIESASTPWIRESDEIEIYMKDIHAIAASGSSVIEAMRTRRSVIRRKSDLKSPSTIRLR